MNTAWKKRLKRVLATVLVLAMALSVTAAAEGAESTAPGVPAVILTNSYSTTPIVPSTSYIEGDEIWPMWTLGTNTDYCNSYWEKYDEEMQAYVSYQTTAPDNFWSLFVPGLGQGITAFEPGQYRCRVEAVNRTTGESAFSDWASCYVYEFVPEIAPTAIELTETLTLEVGETAELTAKILPENADYRRFIWNSFNPDVATVSYGAGASAGTVTITTIKPGTADIFVCTADGDISAVCTVTVKAKKPAAPEVTLSKDFMTSATTFEEGDFVYPTWADVENATHYNVYWEYKLGDKYAELLYYTPGKSGFESFMWVNMPGEYRVKVEAVNTGGVEDEAYWSVSDSEWIDITVAPFETDKPATSIDVVDTLVLEVGETKAVTASVLPADAEYLPLVWYCPDFYIVTFGTTSGVNNSTTEFVGIAPGHAKASVTTGEGNAAKEFDIIVKAKKPAAPEVTLSKDFMTSATTFEEGDFVYPIWADVENATHYNVYWEYKLGDKYAELLYYTPGKSGFESFMWVNMPGEYRVKVEAVNTGGVEDEAYWSVSDSEWIDITVAPFETDKPATSIETVGEITLAVGETKRISAGVLPEDAEYLPLVWYCNDITVAQHMGVLNEDMSFANAVDVTGLKPGKTYISVSTGEGNAVSVINVTVTAAKPGVPMALLGAGSSGVPLEFIEGDYILPAWTEAANADRFNSLWEKLNADGKYELYAEIVNDKPIFGDILSSGAPLWAHEEGSYRYRVTAVNTGGLEDESLWAYSESEWLNFTVKEFIPATGYTAIDFPSEITLLVGDSVDVTAKIVPGDADYLHFAWFYDPVDVVEVALAENLCDAKLTGLKPGSAAILVFTADGDLGVYCAVNVVEHLHVEEVSDVAATCKDTGVVAHWHCSDCGKNFSSADAVQELADIAVPVDPDNHVGGTELRGEKKASYGVAGYTGDTYCLGCETVIAKGSAIPALVPSGGTAGGGSTPGVPSTPSAPEAPGTPETPSAPVTPVVPEAPAVDTSAPTVSTETVEMGDGSTVTTETKEDGVVVETTTNADGSTASTATKTETVETAEGKTTTTVTSTTNDDGAGNSVTENKEEIVVETAEGTTTTVNTTTTTTDAEGNTSTETKVEETIETASGVTATTTTVTETAEKKETVEEKAVTVVAEDGTETTSTTKKTVTEMADGSTGTTTVDEAGTVTAEVSLSAETVSEAVASGETVPLPIPAVPATKDKETAPTVTIATNSAESVAVEVPVENASAGTVIVIVEADGSETVVKTSVVSENGVVAKLPDGATVKIVDNSRDFGDVAADDWHRDAVDFASSRDLFQGVSDDSFAPEDEMTAGMLMTVLARLDGHDTTAAEGQHWQEPGVEWAVANGVHDGSAPDADITREEIALMLWKYAGSPGSEGSLDGFRDGGEASVHTTDALRWAVESGVMSGTGDGILDPTGKANRAQVAQFLKNFTENVL